MFLGVVIVGICVASNSCHAADDNSLNLGRVLYDSQTGSSVKKVQQRRPNSLFPWLTSSRQDPECPTNWIFFNRTRKCYAVTSELDTWENSQVNCKRLNNASQLASVHSMQEADWIQSTLRILTDFTQAWIGLSKNESEESYSWSDGSPVDFLWWVPNWKKSAQRSCATLTSDTWRWVQFSEDTSFLAQFKYVEDGEFNEVSCQKPFKAICAIDAATPPPKPAVDRGPCPKGWYQNPDSIYCYTMTENHSSGYNTEAICAQVHPASHAASLHSREEYKWVADNVQTLSGVWAVPKNAWVGLRQDDRTYDWRWTDGSSSNKIWWQVLEPDYSSTCVSISFLENPFDDAGKLAAVDCGQKRRTVCKLNPKSGNQTVAPPRKDGSNCPVGWTFFSKSNSCYWRTDDHVSWVKTESACAGTFGGAHLASLLSNEEGDFLIATFMNNSYESSLWVGLTFTFATEDGKAVNGSSSVPQWTDGSEKFGVMLARNEPDAEVAVDGVACGQLYKWTLMADDVYKPQVISWTCGSTGRGVCKLRNPVRPLKPLSFAETTEAPPEAVTLTAAHDDYPMYQDDVDDDLEGDDYPEASHESYE